MVFYHAVEVPSVGDYVVGCIRDIQETIGYLVTLPEYDDIEAFVNMREVTRQRYKKLRGIVSVGDLEVVEISAIDDRYIDASRKYLDAGRVADVFSQYKLKKKTFDWLQHGCFLDDIIKQEYVENVVRTEVSDDLVPDRLLDLHRDVIAHTRQQASVDKEHNKNIHLPNAHHSVDILNRHLNHLRSKFNCTISAVTPKNCIYNVTTNFKCQEDDLNKIIEDMKIEETDQTPIESFTNIKEHLSNERNAAQPCMNIGVVGHVSSGKTTLISGLTNVDTRRFKKEILSNRTLRLGYTNITITKCTCSSDQPIYISGDYKCECPHILASIVDCPGHNVLLSTMISGAHLMDVTLIVVAANEKCPQMQAKEHVDIIQIIGKISDHLVIQNKLDLISKESALQHKKQIDRFLDASELSDTHTVPFSAQKQLNVDLVLKWLFENAIKRQKNPSSSDEDSHGIVVRTFDINTPGTQEIKGLIIGGGVCKGTFRLGDEIIILPHRLCTKIIDIKSDKTSLSSAHSGGLIGIQTELNPVWANHLIGSTFVHKNNFIENNLHEKDCTIRVKYYLLKDSKRSSLMIGDILTIHVLAQCIECTVTSIEKSKYCSMKLNKALYVHDNSEFLILSDKRLIGYGRELDSENSKTSHLSKTLDKILVNLPEYAASIDDFYSSLDGLASYKARLPIPKTIYLNTYTTISNFGELCDKLMTAPHDIGKYIHTELGCRSWSINSKRQLILKGNWNENKVMTVLKPFIIYRRCTNCKSLDTIVVSDKGAKKILCKDCNWTEVKQKPV